MSVGDFTRLPAGGRQWQELIEHVRTAYADDRLEAHYLELKSGVDLNEKKWHHKVAKFVLGTANRAPETAARYFGGYAVMLLGISFPDLEGVPAFEDHQVRQGVTKIVGDPGPEWDLVRTSVDGVDVIAVVVDPPQAEHVWPCMSDGDGLTTGTLYVRKGGETRPANGAEVRALLARVADAEVLAEIEVEVVGCAWVFRRDEEAPKRAITQRAAQLRALAQPRPEPRDPRSFGLGAALNDSVMSAALGLIPESRTREAYLAEVDEWERSMLSSLDDVSLAVLRELPAVAVEVRNRSKRWLSDVEVRITLEAAHPMQYDASGVDRQIDRLPVPPEPWGPTRYDALISRPPQLDLPRVRTRPAALGVFTALSVSGGIDEDITIELNIGDLRPLSTVVSGSNELIILTPENALSGRWEMTARDVNTVFEGDLHAALSRESLDITARVLEVLRPALTRTS